MKTIIKSIDFQRNGVHGNPFYTVVYDEQRKFPINDQVFIATCEIEETETGIFINRQTCRVVNVNEPNMAMRGDEMAGELQYEIRSLMTKFQVSNVYELTHINLESDPPKANPQSV